MMQLDLQPPDDEREIRLLKNWLPKIRAEYRAYIKGALVALLHVQEIQGLPTDPDNLGSKG